MSRVKLQPKNPEHDVVVGLDPPLSTFFITVTVKQDEDDLRDLPPVLFQDRWRTADVVEKIEEFAEDTPRRKAVVEYILMDLDPGAVLEGEFLQ